MPRSRVSKALTKTRGPVHGNFEEGARITQGVVALLQSGSQYNSLTAGQKEAVHMIVHKLHRIVTGNSQHSDHWNDIGGYAQLGADTCQELMTKPMVLDKFIRPKIKPRKAKKAAAKNVRTRPVKKRAARPARPARSARPTRPARQRRVRPVAPVAVPEAA